MIEITLSVPTPISKSPGFDPKMQQKRANRWSHFTNTDYISSGSLAISSGSSTPNPSPTRCMLKPALREAWRYKCMLVVKMDRGNSLKLSKKFVSNVKV